MESMEVSAEVHFAQKLAANDKKIRDRALKRLYKYLRVRATRGAGFSELDLLRIWKGLHFCMWMQDKPLIQEELSRRITKLLHAFPKVKDSLTFFGVFLQTQVREWNGIDKLRLDKFLMLTRDMLQEMFVIMSGAQWQEEDCMAMYEQLNSSVMCQTMEHVPDGVRLHLADIFLEELRKVSLKHMTSKKLFMMLVPFISFVAESKKIVLAKRISGSVIQEMMHTMTGHADPSQKDSPQEDSGEEEGEDMEVDDGEKETEPPFQINMFLLYLYILSFTLRSELRQPNRIILYDVLKQRPKLLTQVLQNIEGTSYIRQFEEENPETQAHLQTLLDLGKASDLDQTKQKPRKKQRGRKKYKLKEELEQTSVIEEEEEIGDGDKCDSVSDRNKENADRKLAKKRKRLSSEGMDGENSVSDGREKKSGSSKKKKLNILSPGAAGDMKEDDKDDEEEEEEENEDEDEKEENCSQNNVASDTNSNSKKNQKRQLSRSPMELVKYQSMQVGLHTRKARATHSQKPGASGLPSRRASWSADSGDDSTAVSDPTGEGESSSETKLGKTKKKRKKSSSPARKKTSKSKQTKKKSGKSKEDLESSGEGSSLSESESTESSPSLKSRSRSKNRSGKKKKQSRKKKNSNDDPSCQESTEGESPSSATASDMDQTEPMKPPSQCRMCQQDSNPAPEEGGLMSVLPTSLITTPCNLVRKAIASVRSAPSDRGPSPCGDRSPQCSRRDRSSSTGKKRVVFNLRKNRANKFTDYLKSVSVSPSPSLTQTPSQSILKSPASTSSTPLTHTAEDSTPSTSGRGRKRTRR